MSEEVQRVRSDVNQFATVYEAIDEAVLRADGCDVWIHQPTFEGKHAMSSDCPCEPILKSDLRKVYDVSDHI